MDMQDGNTLGKSYEVSLAMNSTSATSAMASFSKAHVIDLTEGDSTGFTNIGILTTTTSSILPADADGIFGHFA